MAKTLSCTYTTAEGTTRTNEETSADTATDGNHLQMAGLHGLVKLDGISRTALEGGEVQTIAGHEALLLSPVLAMVSFVGRRRCGRAARAELLLVGVEAFVGRHGSRRVVRGTRAKCRNRYPREGLLLRSISGGLGPLGGALSASAQPTRVAIPSPWTIIAFTHGQRPRPFIWGGTVRRTDIQGGCDWAATA